MIVTWTLVIVLAAQTNHTTALAVPNFTTLVSCIRYGKHVLNLADISVSRRYDTVYECVPSNY